MDGLETERSFDSQATWVIDVLGLLFEMLFKGVCTTRHWQTFSRLVQGLNGCTVCGVDRPVARVGGNLSGR